MILALKKLKYWLLTASLLPGPLCSGLLAQIKPNSPERQFKTSSEQINSSCPYKPVSAKLTYPTPRNTSFPWHPSLWNYYTILTLQTN